MHHWAQGVTVATRTDWNTQAAERNCKKVEFCLTPGCWVSLQSTILPPFLDIPVALPLRSQWLICQTERQGVREHDSHSISGLYSSVLHVLELLKTQPRFWNRFTWVQKKKNHNVQTCSLSPRQTKSTWKEAFPTVFKYNFAIYSVHKCSCENQHSMWLQCMLDPRH